ncbi:MAG: hypothetical protein ACLGI6_15425 [Gammaproteobacteria bacterium]
MALSSATVDPARAEANDTTLSWRSDALLQGSVESVRAAAPWGGGRASLRTLEGRLNLYGQCDAGWCQGASAVLRPRLAVRDGNTDLSERPVAWPEAYLMYSSGATQLSFGRRLLGWGPALAYSPTNRLFPDNGAVTPRHEVAGKAMLTWSGSLPRGGQFTALLAEPHAEDLAGERIHGSFGALRAEWRAEGASMATVGLVAGGGGALAPYVGGYAQRTLGEAVTVGVEASFSRRYAANGSAALAALAQNRGGPHADALVNVRYGLASGAELGAELIYNGFALADAELADPRIAALPSTGRAAGWTRPLHPLVQRRYALLQFTSPSLFGDKRWGLTLRTLRGLERRSTDSFAELSWSATDALSLYLGYAGSVVEPALAVSRPVRHRAYLTVESFF